MAANVQLDAILKLIDVQINPAVFRKISQLVAGMPAGLQQTATATANVNTQTRSLNTTLSGTRTQLDANAKAAQTFLKRMGQFAILLPTFATMNRAIQGSVKFLFDFDSALRDIVRVDISHLGGRMEEIGDAALRTAVKLGVTATEVLDLQKTFVQAGLSIEDSQKRAELAIIATQTSTLSSADAVEFFISAANQFNLSNAQLTDALDALVRVEDAAAVEAQDIAEAFRTGGNSMAEFGKNINDSIALISALREQTRKSGREIGTFFKTLQTRIFAEGESRSAVEALGINVENVDGTLRPTLEVLNDLKKSFDGLTEAQAANAAKAIAGVRQFESLVATLNSLDRANELTVIAARAAGAADEKRTVTDEKLERQLGRLIAQGQALAESIGDAGLEDALTAALKTATLLLQAFTKLADITSGLGGNLAPLLALGGVTLGKSVFGLAGFGKPGAGATTAPGQKGFVGPLTPNQQQLFGPIENQVKNVSASFKALGGITKELYNFNLSSVKISAAQGIQTNINAQALKQHTAALTTNIKAIGAAAKAQATAANPFKSDSGTILASLLGATVIPQIFGALSSKLDEAGNPLAASLADTTGSALAMGAQFLAISGKAGLLAGSISIIIDSFSKLSTAFQDEIKAREELTQFDKNEAHLAKSTTVLTGGTPDFLEIQKQLLESLTAAVKNKQIGEELNKSITEGFSNFAKGPGRSDLGLGSIEQVRETLLQSIDVFKTFVQRNKDVIEQTAFAGDRLEEFAKLQSMLANATGRDLGPAFNQLLVTLGAMPAAIDPVTGVLKRVRLDFEEFSKIQDLKEFANNIRNLGLELEVAKQGPDAVRDSVKKLNSELAIAENAFSQNSKLIEENFAGLFERLSEFTVGLNPQGKSVTQFFTTIRDGVRSIDPAKVEQFNKTIESLPPTQQKAAKELLSVLESQVKAEIDVYEKRNAATEEINRRAKEMLDVQNDAALNAFESMQKFNVELKKFGQDVTTEVLSAFQNISLDDVNKVLAGTSDLAPELQSLIQNTLGGKVSEAQTALQAVADETAAQLSVLEKKLAMVNDKLADSANSNEVASLSAEKLAIQLDIEETKQNALVNSSKAKVKVLEEEKKAAEKAAEAEKKRRELIEKLSDASVKFTTELAEINRNFEQFAQQKISDLLEKEADAQGKLKDAQQQVLESTKEVSSAYDALIQAQFAYNAAIAEARIKSNMLAIDIAKLTGDVFTFNGQLSMIGDAFTSVLEDANLTLSKRIELEKQLAEETLSFLQQAKESITQAGIGIFGQTSTENQALGKGIAGLQFIADQLGGSFEAFLNLTEGELSNVSKTLLNLPAEFRQQILSALSFLPTTTNIGGFSVEQLQQAIGQVGTGVDAEAGLPSIEELNSQQVEQLTKLQELAIQDAQLQIGQVIASQQALDVAQAQLDASKILEERAAQGLDDVRMAVVDEMSVLDLANQERRELLNAVIATDDKNTLEQIQREAELFAEQNKVFMDVGDAIIKGVSSAIGAKLAVIEATSNLNNAVKGYVPNFASGNLTPDEAAGLLRAGAREKRAMPAGAGLAVANTSEAIIPMGNKGRLPNFDEGNMSPIAAGIAAIQKINETVVAAISRSVSQALSDIQGGGNNEELLQTIIDQLTTLNSTLDEVNDNNLAINTALTSTTTNPATPTATATQEVKISLQTNQNQTVQITGLESLRDQIAAAVKDAASEQVDEQLKLLLDQLDAIFVALQERGIISGLGVTR